MPAVRLTRAVTCRLEARGLRVLVERPVARTEFPEYDAFHPYEAGTPACTTVG